MGGVFQVRMVETATGQEVLVRGEILELVEPELLAAHWPTSTEPYAPLVNGHQKIVFSMTLTRVDWAYRPA